MECGTPTQLLAGGRSPAPCPLGAGSARCGAPGIRRTIRPARAHRAGGAAVSRPRKPTPMTWEHHDAADPEAYVRLLEERYGPYETFVRELRARPRLRPVPWTIPPRPDPQAAEHYAQLDAAIRESTTTTRNRAA